jgi:hypothetical protein
MTVTQQHYEVSGGSLILTLTTDRPLTAHERAALDHIGLACRVYAEVAPPEPADAQFDTAIAELGGEEAICAG